MFEKNEKSIHVCELPLEAGKDDLEKYFAQFGKIERAYIIFSLGEEKKSRGLGFVQFNSKKSANKVLNIPHKILDKVITVSQRHTKKEIKGGMTKDSTKDASVTGSNLSSKAKTIKSSKKGSAIKTQSQKCIDFSKTPKMMSNASAKTKDDKKIKNHKQQSIGELKNYANISSGDSHSKYKHGYFSNMRLSWNRDQDIEGNRYYEKGHEGNDQYREDFTNTYNINDWQQSTKKQNHYSQNYMLQPGSMPPKPGAMPPGQTHYMQSPGCMPLGPGMQQQASMHQSQNASINRNQQQHQKDINSYHKGNQYYQDDIYFNDHWQNPISENLHAFYGKNTPLGYRAGSIAGHQNSSKNHLVKASQKAANFTYDSRTHQNPFTSQGRHADYTSHPHAHKHPLYDNLFSYKSPTTQAVEMNSQ